ncbi:hypothetical protein GGR52DRAFT_128532 [Hypoxylon sp. FL1284]|nr:hypothetical protein GGR52DRAFT_128532 [Hypoxylon sp. FL1284]
MASVENVPKGTVKSIGMASTFTSTVKSSSTFRSSTKSRRGSESRRWRVRESIGGYGILVIVGGTILSPVMLGLLSVIWSGKGPGSGESATASWRSVVLKGWVTEAVTLCSLVIQLCTSAQAIICTSLAAATLLETIGVPLSHVAEFSTMRGANGGPWRLVYLMFRSSARSFFSLQSILMLILFLGTMATQFASTILVTDLDVSSITGNANHTRLNLTLSDGIELFEPVTSQWYMKPTDYSVFGEIPSGTSVEPTAQGFSDTGNVKRILLPLQHENRTILHHYIGGAYGINSRVACAPPVLNGRFEAFDPLSKPLPFLLTMIGNISYEATFANAGLQVPSLCADGTCLPSQFNCTMPTTGVPGRQGKFLCIPDLSNVVDAENMTYFPDGRKDPVTPHSLVFLVTRNNGTFDDWSFVNNVSAIPDNPSREGEWASWRLDNNVHLDASICFSELLWDFSHVDMSTTHDTIEPSVSMDPKTREVDSRPALTLLGVGPNATSPSNRQLLTVNAVRDTTRNSRLVRYLDGAINSGIFPEPDPPSSFTMNGGGVSYGASSINPFVDYATIYEDSLDTTNRPALAIQAMFTIMAMSLHYGQVQLLDIEEAVSITTAVSVTIPVRWTGLAITAGIVGANLICILAITVLFLLRTRFSRQGHFWHTISQLVSEKTADILEAGPELRDDDAVKQVRTDDSLVVIGRCRSTGRVQVLQKGDPELESA